MISLISAKDLRSYLDDDVSPTIIDVRAPEAYHRGHLPGAINIPREKLSGSLDQVPFDRPVVTYCNMYNPGSSVSEVAAHTLRDAGLHARALEGGYPAWVEAGLPVETNANLLPERRARQAK